jgi:hypothetical protein
MADAEVLLDYISDFGDGLVALDLQTFQSVNLILEEKSKQIIDRTDRQKSKIGSRLCKGLPERDGKEGH